MESQSHWLSLSYATSSVDRLLSFVICSRRAAADVHGGDIRKMGMMMTMMRFSIKPLMAAAVLAALSAPAFAQDATPWDLKPDMGYAYDKQGKTFSYKMGTSNAGVLLKGAKKVPKGTLFFIGQNGQLYMRTGPYLEGDGKFMFGSN
jgi:hypothetical protein